MKRQEEQIQRLGQLAKLDISIADEKLKEDLNKMVLYIDAIRTVDTTGVEPMSHVSLLLGSEINTDLTWNVFREDVPVADQERMSREELLQNAPKTEQGYLVVPKTVVS